MKLVEIDGMILGKGIPKICLPIVAKTSEQAIEQAKKVSGLAADLIELRIDHLDCYSDYKELNKLTTEIRKITDKPVLFTFRTIREGGEKKLSNKQYYELIDAACMMQCVSLIDIEYFTGDMQVKELIQKAHAQNKYVILSNHDFIKTPDDKEIYYRLKNMELLGADIAKIAVMPNSKRDVLRFMNVSQQTAMKLNIPIITMSMGSLGMITRVNGEFTGSCVTFGSGEKASAPGQMNCKDLWSILEIIHNNQSEEK